MNLEDRLRLVKALEEHRECLERAAEEDTRDPDFSCGRAAAVELRRHGIEATEDLVQQMNSRSVEIWELEELIEKVKEERG